jgi:hypothetical protein
MQKTYEWRAHIGKAGIEAVEALWASYPKYEDPEERKAYVDFALGPNLPFMYDSVEHLGADEYKVCPMHISNYNREVTTHGKYPLDLEIISVTACSADVCIPCQGCFGGQRRYLPQVNRPFNAKGRTGLGCHVGETTNTH